MRKRILAINGSASRESSNLAILVKLAEFKKESWEVEIIDDLGKIPHFQTEMATNEKIPESVANFRESVATADGVIICTPEYVFSIPSRLKNALEWCVSTTVFTNKPVALITASASGEVGHESLQLIMRTIQAKFTAETILLIQGAKRENKRRWANNPPRNRR